MFSRYRKDTEPEEIVDSTAEEIFSDPEDLITAQPEIVEVVEKISVILSPYFIVLVGLLLYKENVYIANSLILIGILSLLKISWGDIIGFFEGLKNFLGRAPDDTID
jgi:hypothetical protein